MEEVSGVIADHGANIQTIRHERAAPELDVGEAYLVFQIETSGTEHARRIIRTIRSHDYEVRHINA